MEGYTKERILAELVIQLMRYSVKKDEEILEIHYNEMKSIIDYIKQLEDKIKVEIRKIKGLLEKHGIKLESLKEISDPDRNRN